MTHDSKIQQAARDLGFTLVEVLLAVTIGSMVLLMVTQTFQATLQTQDEIGSLTASNADAQRILTLFERDLEGLWHHNIKRNQVLVGTDRQIVAEEADFIDFLTTSDAITGVIDNTNSLAYPSICEVGYWLRPNPRFDDLIELWRREDPLVDDDIRTGGRFQLVSDRLKWFKLTYYETLGYRAEPRDEWDSSKEGRLPRRIQLEFEIERDTTIGGEVGDLEEVGRTYIRHFTLDQRYEAIMNQGVALVPVVPTGPPSNSGGGGPGGGPGGTGDATSVTTSGAVSFTGQGQGRGDQAVSRTPATTQTGPRGAPPGPQGSPPPAAPPIPIDLRDLFGNGGNGGFGGFGGFGG
ncbi:MAG: prepilin-type N-terminal cleavage/methylation domain-containing protein [Planctomycetota bacterium]